MFSRKILPWLLAAGVLVFAFWFRRTMAERSLASAEKLSGGEFVPRTIEEGVIYHYIRALADGAPITVPAGSEAYSASAQMSLAMERFLASGVKLRRLFCGTEAAGAAGSHPAEDRFMRLQLTWWVALIPVSVLWILLSCRAPWPLALGGALLETVAAGACARYTGEVLVKGTFALPLITLALGAQFAYLSNPRRWMLVLLAFLTFMACASWDATQLFLGLWCAVEAIRLLFGGKPHHRNYRSFLALFVGMVLAAVLSPYCRQHMLILSPTVLAVAPLAFMLNLKKFTPAARWMLALLVCGVWLAAANHGVFMGNYSHFTSLLWAKLRFANIKPLDPSLLTFDQRYLWTPALNSVSWPEFKILFPVAVWLCAAVLTALAFFRRRRSFYGARLVAMLAAYLLLSVLFYRFSVFASLFMALVLPLALTAFYRKSPVAVKLVCIAAMAAVVGLEWHHTTLLKRGHSPLLQYQSQLAACLSRYDFGGETLLTNMDVGGILYAHTNANIIIQPKFELAPVRELTRQYTLLLFDPDPARFVRWCGDHGVRFYLHAVNTADWPPLTSDGAAHIYSQRYMAAVNPPSPACVAMRCDRGRTGLESLVELAWPKEFSGLSDCYRLYLVVGDEDRELAEFDADAALDAFAEGDIVNARRLASKAWLAAPCEYTYDAFCRIYANFPLPPEPGFYFKSR